MNDDELDRTIRSGLAELADQAHEPAPFPVDAAPRGDLPQLGPPRRERGSHRIRYLSVAAAFLLAVVGLGVWTLVGDTGDGDIDAVDDVPEEPGGFEAWGPGWHPIDPGPVPAMHGAQLMWSSDRLVVAGSAPSGSDGSVARVFAFDPATRDWSELPRPPVGASRFVVAGERLVAVGSDEEWPAEPVREWATLAQGAGDWVVHGPVPESPVLAQAGAIGVGVGRDRLVWTGERVIDVGLGAVLDPATGTATELPVPSDVIAYTHLLAATPVWTGDQVVLTAWSDRPGLAWNALGADRTDVPGPVTEGWPRSTSSAAPTVAIGGEVVLASDGTDEGSNPSSTGYIATFDPATGEWTRLPDIPGPSNTTCPYRLTAVGDSPVVQPCSDGTDEALRLVGDTWNSIGAPPISGCCITSWLGTDDALVTWSTDADTLNDPRAPYVDAAVWVPPSDAADSTPAGSAGDERSEGRADRGAWRRLPTGPADGRTFPAFAWAGDRLVIWGGETTSEVEWTDSGAVYDPATQTWDDMADAPLSPRSEASAAWTGTELFICCGRSPGGGDETAAAAYDPGTDAWRDLAPAPTTVAFGTAVWTGSEVLVVGPNRVGWPGSSTVALAFDPTSGEWRQLDAPPVALGATPPVSWTGEEAVVWTSVHSSGGSGGFTLDVDAGTWQELPSVPDELAIDAPAMVATATEVLIWGPPVDAPTTSAGAVLDRTSGEWRPMADDPLGSGERGNGVVGSPSAAWTGSEMVIWTGAVAAAQPQSDTRIIAYAPATDTWRELGRADSTAHRPQLALDEDLLAIATHLPSMVALDR